MKKKMCYLFLLIICAFMMSAQNVKAYNAPSEVGICFNNVEFSKYSFTGWYTKNVGGNQAVTLDRAWTNITNPCPKCIIGFKPYKSNGDAYTGISLVMGNRQEFVGHDGSAWTGDYKLGMMREDFTLMKTFIEFLWKLN